VEDPQLVLKTWVDLDAGSCTIYAAEVSARST
jgi:hypothetical protein